MIILPLFILGIFLSYHLIFTIYVYQQAKSICLWINNEKSNSPAVGPGAYEHLTWLKQKSKGNYDYKIVEPTYHGHSPIRTILISENGLEKIRLNYTMNFILPTYFHHQTNFEHDHDYNKWPYKD